MIVLLVGPLDGNVAHPLSNDASSASPAKQFDIGMRKLLILSAVNIIVVCLRY